MCLEQGNVAVRLYEPVSADIVGDFGKNILKIGGMADFQQGTARE